jgi:hypothetical protein
MSKIATQFASVPASAPHLETWIDRAVPAGSKVGLLVGPSEDELNSEYTWWTLSFWNKSVQRSYVLPGGDSFAEGYYTQLTPDLATGGIDGLGGTGYLVKLTADARVGLRGSLLARVRGLDLYRLAPAAPLTYSTLGVNQAGGVAIHSAPLIHFYGNGVTPVRKRVTVTLQVVPPERGCPCTLYTGSQRGAVSLPTAPPGGTEVVFSRAIDLAPHGGVTLPLVVRGRAGEAAHLGVNLISVRIAPR